MSLKSKKVESIDNAAEKIVTLASTFINWRTLFKQLLKVNDNWDSPNPIAINCPTAVRELLVYI